MWLSMLYVVNGLYNCRPPRCMGDGFVVLQSSDIDIYYYQDEPGVCVCVCVCVHISSLYNVCVPIIWVSYYLDYRSSKDHYIYLPLVQLSYLGKLWNQKNHEFSLKLQIFQMLQSFDICKS